MRVPAGKVAVGRRKVGLRALAEALRALAEALRALAEALRAPGARPGPMQKRTHRLDARRSRTRCRS
jgi:nucleoid-associated protein YgaU